RSDCGEPLVVQERANGQLARCHVLARLKPTKNTGQLSFCVLAARESAAPLLLPLAVGIDADVNDHAPRAAALANTASHRASLVLNSSWRHPFGCEPA